MHESDERTDGNEFLLLDEVARICRAPVSTVRHWVSVGKLPSIRPARRRLVRRRDLEHFLGSAAVGQR